MVTVRNHFHDTNMLQLQRTGIWIFCAFLVFIQAGRSSDLDHVTSSENGFEGYNLKEIIMFTTQNKSYQKDGVLYISLKHVSGYSLVTPRGKGARLKRAASGPTYSPYTCCRYGKNYMTRTKTVNGILSIEAAQCGTNYCRDCANAENFCDTLFSRAPQLCNTAFMLHNCPKSCSICQQVPPVTTAALKQIVIIYQKPGSPDKFKYLLASSPAPGGGFQRTNSYLKTISMYSRPTGAFTKAIYFCFRSENNGDYVSLSQCPSAINEAVGPPPPVPVTSQPTPRPIFTTRPAIVGPPQTPARPGMSADQRQCLEAHNYFRAKHNTAALIWDNSLAATATSWARYLSMAAPENQNVLRPGYTKTPYWPHSVTDTQYRPKYVGENIALIPLRSSQRQTVEFWYSEIFDYNQATGTRMDPNKPIGHYTQLLWQQTKRIGCAKVSNSQVQAWVVAHYKWSGNYRNAILANVMPPTSGTCIQRTCAYPDACLAYGQSSTCLCGAGRSPQCTGTQGCMARCKRNVCTGTTSCRCSNGQALCV